LLYVVEHAATSIDARCMLLHARRLGYFLRQACETGMHMGKVGTLITFGAQEGSRAATVHAHKD
jgi:hypothetical protein